MKFETYHTKKLAEKYVYRYLIIDKLGKLPCTIKGCKKCDTFVLSLCKKFKIPVQVSMGGGYSPEIKTIIEAHANTFRAARNIYY
jgi:acetoin utilization deacetylase AcuC-like enzyme